MLDLIKGILEHEGIPYLVIDDLGVIMRFKNGKINPMTCGVYAYPDHPILCTIITDFYEAVEFINIKTLKRC